MLKQVGIIVILIVVIMLVSSFSAKAMSTIGNPFTSDNSRRIYNQGIKRGMGNLMSKLLVAWSKWETGNYKSHFTKDFNTYFGYSRDPNSKWQIGGGTNADNGKPIARYGSLEDSVNEIVDWMNRRYMKQDRGKWPNPKNISSPKQLADLLQKSWYGNYLGVAVGGLTDYLKSNV